MKLLTIIILLSAKNCYCQMPARIDSILYTKGQTIFVRATLTEKDSTVFFPVTFMGLGKKPYLIGIYGTYYPNGTTRRKVHFIPSKTKL